MNYKIATIGSHSALQILKGAKDEGFETIAIVTPDRKNLYKRFPFIDEIIKINSYQDFPSIENVLIKKNAILIPHGSFVAYLNLEKHKKLRTAYFGNKSILDWEKNRVKQHVWLSSAKLNLPRQFTKIDKNIKYPVIVKTYGAAGGKGYFMARNRGDLEKKLKKFPSKNYIVQEYIIGVTLYIHYFYSSLSKTLEILSMDRRYETNADGIGRIPAFSQKKSLKPSYVVVGNSPLVLRESLLTSAYNMGERVVAASKKLIDKKGLFGPFCLETVITPELKLYCIEISGRIVAGTNLFIDHSPYSSLLYNKPVSTGRRIAMEIKQAIKIKKLSDILD